MFGSSKKPYTAITVQIERLTSDAYAENDYSGIVDLVEVIRLQDSGPAEAARAIRKKLYVSLYRVVARHIIALPPALRSRLALFGSKYGSVHRQLRALTILDGLIQNAGSRFQLAFADEALLERLRIVATDPVSAPEVKVKCQILFGQWAANYRDTAGLGAIAALYRELPQRQKPLLLQQREADDDADHDHAHAHAHADESRRRPAANAGMDLDPSRRRKPSLSLAAKGPAKKERAFLSPRASQAATFNLEKEKPQLLQTLAASSVASTSLMNALKLINREHKRVTDDGEVMKQFAVCKSLRRQILRYIQLVESEQWLGSLIHANEELVNALRTLEVLDKSLDDDSDSDSEPGPDPGHADIHLHEHPNANVARSFARMRLAANANNHNNNDAPPKGKARAREDRHAAAAAADNDDGVDDDDDDDDADNPFADRNAIG
ncbi:MAG: putative actin patch assembly and actin polymerization protein [Phylliscum demangeonii]|nr:MAG: putative actin patch assembly and actin polymerization protein [Phylliscum demangeonii]